MVIQTQNSMSSSIVLIIGRDGRYIAQSAGNFGDSSTNHHSSKSGTRNFCIVSKKYKEK